ncbi:MAG TPA: hypothetical protein VGY98_08075 [Verrucomicrobiae bacterium]|nr:hypothetical protein [Verrucomicrobiae bacterium]
MDKRNPRPRFSLKILSWVLLKIAVYAAFVTTYYFFVLLLLAHWLKDVFVAHRAVYTFVTLPLIIAQAALLDLVVTGLRKLGQGKKK